MKRIFRAGRRRFVVRIGVGVVVVVVLGRTQCARRLGGDLLRLHLLHLQLLLQLHLLLRRGGGRRRRKLLLRQIRNLVIPPARHARPPPVFQRGITLLTVLFVRIHFSIVRYHFVKEFVVVQRWIVVVIVVVGRRNGVLKIANGILEHAAGILERCIAEIGIFLGGGSLTSAAIAAIAAPAAAALTSAGHADVGAGRLGLGMETHPQRLGRRWCYRRRRRSTTGR